MLRYGDVVTLRFESFVGNDINPHSWARRLRLAKASQDNTPLSPRVAAPESRNESSLREVRAAFARAGPSEGVVCSTDKIHNHECYLCHADDPAVLRQSDRRKCLFQLIPQLSYTAKAELQRALDRVAVPRHRGASSSGHAARTKTRRVTAEHSNAERPRSASQENSLSRKSSSFLLRRRSVTNLGRILSTDGDEPGAYWSLQDLAVYLLLTDGVMGLKLLRGLGARRKPDVQIFEEVSLAALHFAAVRCGSRCAK